MSSKLITDSFKQVKSRNLQPTKHKTQVESSNNRDIVGKTEEHAEKRDFEVLRDFDLQTEYGPCIGITRLERWERASRFGLSPPQQVRELIKMNMNDDRYTQCVWNDYNI